MRSISRLGEDRFDVAVVGGGVQGVCVAREAQRRGYRTALIERDDWGAGTSHNSFKLIHGGFRYLQHLDLGRIRDSIRASRWWSRTAPDTLRVLPCVIPTYSRGVRRKTLFRVANRVYDVVSFDRNRGVDPSVRIPSGEVVSRDDVLELAPHANRRGDLTGGMRWYDAQLQDAGRLLIRLVQDAERLGACCANHLEALALKSSRTGVEGIHAVDRLSGKELGVSARCVVVCTGPWTTELFSRNGGRPLSAPIDRWIKGMNLAVRVKPLPVALGLPSNIASDAIVGSDKRVFFWAPWHEWSLFGTSHESFAGKPERVEVERDEALNFMDQLSNAFPHAQMSEDDLLYCYFGVTPAAEEEGYSGRARENSLVDHGRQDGVEGLISVLGVKYTTAPDLAQRALAIVESKLGPGAGPKPEVPLPAEKPCESLEASVRQAVAEEDAFHLTDVFMRRLGLAERDRVDARMIERVAREMQKLRGWDQREREAQRSGLEVALRRQLVPLRPA